MNSMKTVALLGLLSGILLFGGEMLGGSNGLVIGLILAIGMNFFSYFYSDKLALASCSAQPLTQDENPEIYARMYPLIQGLAQRMNLPMPKLWVIPDPSPNAFATGRDPQHASVAFTEGILGLMSDRELEA
jgi:heat shock protein HtpX